MVTEIRNELLNLAKLNFYSEWFIETGTCHGEGIKRAMLAGYTKIRSVEVYEDFYVQAMQTFKTWAPAEGKYNAVQLYLGKSYEELPKMLEGVDKAVIMLDAHPAGPNTGGHVDLMKNGNNSEYAQHNIITRELQVILENSRQHLIIIDDQNGTNNDNVQYMEFLKSQNDDYRFYWFDEKLSKDAIFYPKKYLVCVPLTDKL